MEHTYTRYTQKQKLKQKQKMQLDVDVRPRAISSNWQLIPEIFLNQLARHPETFLISPGLPGGRFEVGTPESSNILLVLVFCSNVLG